VGGHHDPESVGAEEQLATLKLTLKTERSAIEDLDPIEPSTRLAS